LTKLAVFSTGVWRKRREAAEMTGLRPVFRLRSARGAQAVIGWGFKPTAARARAAAARAGAPLGHDFCAVSLSDLLTPKAEILARLRAAAEGDFVVALYNPVSARRRALFPQALGILGRHRPPQTPVVVAANLGRAGERVSVRRLDEVTVDEVDMLTVVIVGSSHTRALRHGGEARAFTPRGYAAKRQAVVGEGE
jgi:cobalt-precorrin 5A hydrolase/precorrin-3B C17-methyltransferase